MPSGSHGLCLPHGFPGNSDKILSVPATVTQVPAHTAETEDSTKLPASFRLP